jgi:uncharacterized phage infection (PIP) family protein YhgE
LKEAKDRCQTLEKQVSPKGDTDEVKDEKSGLSENCGDEPIASQEITESNSDLIQQVDASLQSLVSNLNEKTDEFKNECIELQTNYDKLKISCQSLASKNNDLIARLKTATSSIERLSRGEK